MKARLAQLVAELRRGGVSVSVAEAIDAAAAFGIAGVERDVLRDALAAALVKREDDRPIYEQAFARMFPASVAAPAAAGRRHARRSPVATGGEGGLEGGRGTGGESGTAAPRATGAPTTPRASGAAGSPHDEHDAPRRARHPSSRDDEPPADDRPGIRQRERRRSDARQPARDRPADAERLARRAREHELVATPFRAMSARDVEEASALVRALARRFRARLSRRLRRRTRGRLDFRATIRASISHGGVAVERRFRGRRPRRLALVALCDLSASAATATGFFLALLAPAADHFARVRLFGYVDRLVEIEFADGQVRPAGRIDLMARSDFGAVLRDFAAGPADELSTDTLLLVLGDARNNRRPPRADLLAAARARVRRLLWLDPEPLERWNTGDSVIAAYARHCDAVVSCASLAELDAAIAAICAV